MTRGDQRVRYGYFDDEKREYIITNPRTPVKWINFVGALAFGGFVDHTGGALICKGDPALNRITKYIAQMPASDFKGETLYLRLKQGGQMRVFSPYFVPTLDAYELYECHVGLGYMRIESQFYGIRAQVTVFVPPDESCAIRDVRVTNATGEPVELDAVPVVEYTHPDALKQLTNADWVPQTMVSRVVTEADGHKILLQYPFMFRDTRVNYFTSNHHVASFESERVSFLGDHEYGTWARPLSLQEDELGNHEAWRGDNIAALLHHLGVIAPGESRRLITQLGQDESLEKALPRIQFFRDERNVDRALVQLAEFWQWYLSRLQVQTPDAAMNRMLNIHNPRQCHTTKQWSRYLSLYQLGYGARGIGFRDSSQDVLGVLASMPEEAKSLIRQLLRVQRRNGSAMHQFNPLTMEASAGDARERPDLPQYHSDDHLWAVLAVCAYLKESGDLSFLDEVIPFYDKGAEGAQLEEATVLQHLRRGLRFTRQNVGAHGLPLLGFADWNDTVNLRTGAESLFTASLYGKALLEMLELARHRHDGAAKRYQAHYQEMKQRVNACAWDGKWYVRYFDCDGTPLGSHHNEHGQIYANGQSWPVISGFATAERARTALDAAYAWLNTRHGIKLSTPGFDGFDARRGGITTYPPGAKENGGIFLHANPWMMIAETLLGNGDRAYEYYRQINPALKNAQLEQYQCEPYVYAQNILGDEHPQFGRARNSWLTGTAAWAYGAGTQHILGIRPAYAGLQIDPCIPRGWDGFHVRRCFRGSTYEVSVANPQHVCRGVGALRVDGEQIPGNLVPAFGDGAVHQVDVIMGEQGDCASEVST